MQIYPILLLLNELQCGNIKIKEILNENCIRQFEDFQLFLKVLEIYGCGYFDDIDRNNYNRRLNISHSQQAVEELNEIIFVYKKAINELKDNNDYFDGNENLKIHIVYCLQFQYECFNELLAIQQVKANKTYTGNEKNDDYEAIKEGHLVMMKCGHRGRPSRMEEKRISRLLRKSGFIPMLEEIYKKHDKDKDHKKESKNIDKDRDDMSSKGEKIIMVTERA